MRAVDLIKDPGNRLDVVAGLIDGILNALTLAAGRLLQGGGGGATLGLAVRVSMAAGATTVFVFFVAHYAQLRLELVRQERELNLTSHGRMVATRLGRRALVEASCKAALASAFSVAGALFPLLVCTSLPSRPLLGLGITIAMLGILGALLARTFFGSAWLWAAALVLGGAISAVIGAQLDLVG